MSRRARHRLNWTDAERIRHGKKMFELREQDGITYENIASQYRIGIKTVQTAIIMYLESVHEKEKAREIYLKSGRRRTL